MGALAAVLFAVAAVIGAIMAAQVVRGAERPATSTALAHGGFAAAGLALYAIVVATASSPPTAGWIAIAIFVVAALGGSVLFAGYHLRARSLPVPVVFVHGGVAVVGFLVLLVALFT